MRLKHIEPVVRQLAREDIDKVWSMLTDQTMFEQCALAAEEIEEAVINPFSDQEEEGDVATGVSQVGGSLPEGSTEAVSDIQGGGQTVGSHTVGLDSAASAIHATSGDGQAGSSLPEGSTGAASVIQSTPRKSSDDPAGLDDLLCEAFEPSIPESSRIETPHEAFHAYQVLHR